MPMTPELRRGIDRIRDYLFGGGYPNPAQNAEQLSFLIYFYMYETADAARMRAAQRPGAAPYASVFEGEWTLRDPRNARAPGTGSVPRELLRWSSWAHALNGERLVSWVREEVFPFHAELAANGVTDFMDGARLVIDEPTVLTQVVSQLNPRFPDKAGTGSEKERTLRAKSAILPLEMRSPRRCAMDTVIPRPPQVEMDFTDARLTGFGGWSVLGQMAARLDLPRALSAVSVKQRARGASDAETLWSLIASLAAGNGALSALDALREDRVGQRLLGLGRVPSGRRLGEYLARIDEAQVETLLAVARGLAAQVAPAVVEHEAAVRGYVPVFVDGTAIEVDGKLFEEARRGYDGTRQYWLHGVFIGTLWVSGRLHPGGGDVAGGWRGQLDSDVAPCLPEGTPVWLRADNAYYRGELIAWCRERGWDYSISLTHARKRAPVLDVVEGLPEDGWTDIGLGEDATLVRYRPAGWEEQSYVVIRRRRDRGQTLLLPVYTVILVSRDDLPLDELVRRHRGKQGQENAFKGPLIDLDLHHPPCRRFRANQAFYICGQIAQVLLRAVQYQLLPARARRHGLRPLIRYLVRVVGRLVRSGRRWRLDFARNNFRLDWLYHAAVQLE